MPEATERLSTTEDGPQTVNERLSTGGPGPEGQPDTAKESLSGQDASAEPVAVEDVPRPRKATARKS